MLLVKKARAFISAYKAEAVIFCLALFIRLASVFLLFERFGIDFYTEAGTVDTHSYLSLGRSLASGEGFRFFGETSALRTPIYPLFLSLFYLASIPLWLIPIAQALIGGASAVILYRIGRLFFSPRAGILAALLFSLEPYILFLPAIIMSETIFYFFLLAAVLCFGHWTINQNNRAGFFSGIFLGLAILTRPVMPYVLAAIFVIGYIWFALAAKIQPWRERFRRARLALVFAAVFFLTLLPWNLRNFIVFGAFDLSNVYTNVVLYFRVLPIAVADRDGVDYQQAIKTVTAGLPELIPGYNATTSYHTFAYTERLKRDALFTIKQHRGAVARYYLAEFLPVGILLTGYNEIFDWFAQNWRNPDPDLTALLRQGNYGEAARMLAANSYQMVLAAGALFWLLAYAAIFVGALRLWRGAPREERLGIAFCFVLAAFFIAVSVGPPLYVRYRVNSYPFLFLLLGCIFAKKNKALLFFRHHKHIVPQVERNPNFIKRSFLDDSRQTFPDSLVSDRGEHVQNI